MKIVTVTDPRTGETSRLTIWNGKGARVDQVNIQANGKPWKSMGVTRLSKSLAKLLSK